MKTSEKKVKIYKSEFAAKIKESRKQVREGKFSSTTLEELEERWK